MSACQCFQLRDEKNSNKSNKSMNKNYNIIAFFFPPLEDTKAIQERSIARIFADQIHERDPYPTGLVCMTTLLTTTNRTYSKPCFCSERCFPYTDWGTTKLRSLETSMPLSSLSRKQLMTSQKMRCLQTWQLLAWSFQATTAGEKRLKYNSASETLCVFNPKIFYLIPNVMLRCNLSFCPC